MFDDDRQDSGTPIDQSALLKIASKNEDGFIQRMIINSRYNVNCNRLTIWEYFLVIEKLLSEKPK
jgi:hypothetical protein